MHFSTIDRMCLLILCVVGVGAQFDPDTDIFLDDANVLKSIPQDWNIKNRSNIRRIVVLNINVEIIKSNAFQELINLKELWLLGRVTAIEDKAFNGLINIECIRLERNRIQNIGSHVFNNLNTLKYLHIVGNNINRIRLKNLTKLEKLFLSDNNIKNLSNNNFIKLERLGFIDLSYNKIITIKSGAFTGCPQLTELKLNNNQLVHIEKGAFRNVRELSHLELHHNNLTTILANYFNVLTSLTTLDLSHNNISSFDLFPLINLKTLILNNNKITSFTVCIPGSLTNLDLSQNDLHEIAFDKICGPVTQGSLQRVDLSFNRFTSYNLTHSNKSLQETQPQLQEIDLNWNFFNADFVKVIQNFQLRHIYFLKIESQREVIVSCNGSSNRECNPIGNKANHENEITTLLTTIEKIDRDEKQNTTWIAVNSAVLAAVVFAVIGAILFLYKQRIRMNSNQNTNDAVLFTATYDDCRPAITYDDVRASRTNNDVTSTPVYDYATIPAMYDYPIGPLTYDDAQGQPAYLTVLPDSPEPQRLKQQNDDYEEINHYEEID